MHNQIFSDDFSFVVPIQRQSISRFVVRAFDKGKETILYSGNDIDKSSDIFSANTGKGYGSISWSINHTASFEINDEEIFIISYLKNILKKIRGLF
jgi:hypothetical protein